MCGLTTLEKTFIKVESTLKLESLQSIAYESFVFHVAVLLNCWVKRSTVNIVLEIT